MIFTTSKTPQENEELKSALTTLQALYLNETRAKTLDAVAGSHGVAVLQHIEAGKKADGLRRSVDRGGTGR